MQSKQKLNLRSKARAAVTKNQGVNQKIGLQGVFHVEHWREGELIGVYDFENGIVNVGKDYLLNVGFNGQAQISTWYVGLINNSPAPTLADADTMASHAGWVESAAYNEANRVEWTEGAASGQSITNSTALTFTMNATVTIYGIFVTSDNTKSGTSGTLWSTAAFSSPVSVVNTDELKVTYTINA